MDNEVPHTFKLRVESSKDLSQERREAIARRFLEAMPPSAYKPAKYFVSRRKTTKKG